MQYSGRECACIGPTSIGPKHLRRKKEVDRSKYYCGTDTTTLYLDHSIAYKMYIMSSVARYVERQEDEKDLERYMSDGHRLSPGTRLNGEWWWLKRQFVYPQWQ